jgi:hypothetical protein
MWQKVKQETGNIKCSDFLSIQLLLITQMLKLLGEQQHVLLFTCNMVFVLHRANSLKIMH